jgi:threonine synthase
MIRSTRSHRQVDLETALLEGLADDGGLFVFDQLDPTFFNQVKGIRTYSEWVALFLTHFFPKWDESTIESISHTAYNAFKPARVLVDDAEHFAWLELYHGPTFSFKDMALQGLPHLIETAKKNKNIDKKTLVLTATSGDTGSAALAGYQSFKDAMVIVLYPKDGVSLFQALQMNSMQGKNHIVYGIDGHFDDAQDIVKEAFKHVDRSKIHVTSANSINIGRLLLQMVYYFYSYMNLVQKQHIKLNESINVVVPSGNFGNVLSAYYAKQLGLPIHKCIVSSNQNNILTQFFSTGTYTVEAIKNSVSPSMDISIPSNLERYLYELSNKDAKTIKEAMATLKETGTIHCQKVLEQRDFYANYATEDETLETIKAVYKEHKKLIDPHTAVAKTVYDKYQKDTNDEHYTVIVSTASPYKFTTAVLDALDQPTSPHLQEMIESLSELDHTVLDGRIMTLLSSSSVAKTCLKDEALKKVVDMIEKQTR